MAWRPVAAVVLVLGMIGCGGGNSSGGEPGWGTVKELAQHTPPMNQCPGGKTAETRQRATQSNPGPELEDASRGLVCTRPPSLPLVAYQVFGSNAERDQAIKRDQPQYDNNDYFVGNRTIVRVITEPPVGGSPLAQRIKDKCGCGQVRRSGEPTSG
jgi:hypothetical protein